MALAAGGFLLSGVFRASVEGDFDSRLRFDLEGMIAAAEPDKDGHVILQGHFADPRFERIYSGWYWQIGPVDRANIRPSDTEISRSLWDQTIKVTNSQKEGPLIWGRGTGPSGQRLRTLQQRVEFPIADTRDPNDVRAYQFMVAADLSEIEDEISNFNGTLLWSFGLLGLGLIVAVFLQVRIGLQPLRKVREALANIRDGKARQLEGNFPAEIAPLASELNALIEHNAEIVARARTHVSNLAHFLKTPLTVLTSEASSAPGPLADAVQRQVTTMRRQVDHYLARARASGALDVLGNRAPVKAVLDDLARVLRRIHAEKNLFIDVDCPAPVVFRGDRQDLEEMAGNLIDNACKWAKSRISVRAWAEGAWMLLVVGDDGPGLHPEDRARVLERGGRLDESVPGSGLGLAIVSDISKLYGGGVELAASPMGGLEVRLKLPAVA